MRNFKYEYNLDHFRKVDDISYYLLGVVLTDGCIKTGTGKGSIDISSKDKDWLEAIRVFTCPKKPIYESKKDNCFVLTLSHPEIRNFFILNKCTPRKSLTVEMPDIPKEYFPDFLRGCIDGDGCILLDRSIHCELTTGSKYFANSLFTLLKEFNPKLYCYNNKYYKLRFNGVYAYKFLKYIYYPNNKISMNRKIQLCQKAINYYEKYDVDFKQSASEIEHKIRVSTQSGSKNGASKLDEAKVKLILELSKTISTKELMLKFNVSKTTINRIKSGKLWKAITNCN